jgi:hypothetical protein
MVEYLTPEPAPRPASEPRRWWTQPWTITGAIAIVGAILIFGASIGVRLMIAPMYAATAGMMDQMDIEGGYTVVNDYMIAMYYGDAERAYRFYSSAARQEISQQDLEDELEGPLAVMYQAYNGYDFDTPITQQAQNPGARNFEEAMEGMRIIYDGVFYISGYDNASYHAVVIFEAGDWKIAELRIAPPPDLD